MRSICPSSPAELRRVRLTDVQDVLRAYQRTPHRIVCLTGTNTAYRAAAADVIGALRAAGATWVVLAGPAIGLLAYLVDDHITMGEDMGAFLRRTRTAIDQAVPITATQGADPYHNRCCA